MKKNERNLIIALLIIIILLIIFFFLIGYLGRIEVKIPTGNIDIFDIIFLQNDNNCKCCDCNYCECIDGCNCSKKENNIEVSNDYENSQDENTGMIVHDSELTYATSTPLNIFTHNSYYIKDDVIAPGSQNTYQFIVRNNNDYAIIYNLDIMEENKYEVNMKYRLKMNGQYILGNEQNWVDTNVLRQYEVILTDKSYNVYSLDWKWFESDNDTNVGMNIKANYQLNIELFASIY